MAKLFTFLIFFVVSSCQPKTYTLDCVLVQVGSWVSHVVFHLQKVSMCNSNHSIGMSIIHTTFCLKNMIDQVFKNIFSPCGHGRLTSPNKNQHPPSSFLPTTMNYLTTLIYLLNALRQHQFTKVACPCFHQIFSSSPKKSQITKALLNALIF